MQIQEFKISKKDLSNKPPPNADIAPYSAISPTRNGIEVRKRAIEFMVESLI